MISDHGNGTSILVEVQSKSKSIHSSASPGEVPRGSGLNQPQYFSQKGVPDRSVPLKSSARGREAFVKKLLPVSRSPHRIWNKKSVGTRVPRIIPPPGVIKVGRYLRTLPTPGPFQCHCSTAHSSVVFILTTILSLQPAEAKIKKRTWLWDEFAPVSSDFTPYPIVSMIAPLPHSDFSCSLLTIFARHPEFQVHPSWANDISLWSR